MLDLTEQAVVKSYSISVGDSGTKVDRFVAYMVPAEELPPRDASDGTPADRCFKPLLATRYRLTRLQTSDRMLTLRVGM